MGIIATASSCSWEHFPWTILVISLWSDNQRTEGNFSTVLLSTGASKALLHSIKTPSPSRLVLVHLLPLSLKYTLIALLSVYWNWTLLTVLPLSADLVSGSTKTRELKGCTSLHTLRSLLFLSSLLPLTWITIFFIKIALHKFLVWLLSPDWCLTDTRLMPVSCNTYCLHIAYLHPSPKSLLSITSRLKSC